MKTTVALVTGGTRGIGLGIAKALAQKGLNIVVTGRRSPEETQPALDEICNQFGARELEVAYFQSDVAVADDRRQLLASIESRFGRLDVLVNNAGIAPEVRADVLEASEESFDKLMATNLKGPYFLTQAVARWMLRQRGERTERRSIVNISSISAVMASVNRGDYCISKAGISMATKLWAARLAPHGIGVYEIRPGIISTDMTRGVKEKYDRMIDRDLLLEKRWGTQEDIGKVTAMLVMGELPYSPGAVMTVDGGLSLPRLS
jgi:NAD(P)-dependent dehydrogenase (short-subunit alcohol dehydrogenase family)